MKYQVFIFLFFSLSVIKTSGQLVFNKSVHDLGEVVSQDDKFFDFKLTNLSSKPSYFLRYDKQYGISLIVSKKIIMPDSTIIIRIKYTPKRKGGFKSDVPVWFSTNNKPIVFTIKGNALEVDYNESLECPSFSRKRHNENLFKHKITFNVLDRATKKPIKRAVVNLFLGGLIYKKILTNEKGKATILVKQNGYNLMVEAKKYVPVNNFVEITREKKSLTVLLGKDKSLFQKELVEDVIQNPENIKSSQKIISTSELPVDKYKPNHTVFLIDISTSMKQSNKLELLKQSITELVKGLRSIDKISIITYASNTKVLVSGEFITNKGKLYKIINSFEARGYTNGVKGLNKAFEIAGANFIKGGYNQIIMVTDGAFSLNSQERIIRKIRNKAKNNIFTSVVGIKNKSWIEKSMGLIAEKGGGSYIKINNKNESKTALIKDIQSKLEK